MGGAGSGSKNTTWTMELRSQLKMLAATGMTMGQIALEMGLTRGQISSAIARYDVELESAKRQREMAAQKKQGLEYLPTRANVVKAPEPTSLKLERIDPDPEPEPEEEVAEEEMIRDLEEPREGVTILELEDDMCRFPMGDRYCGKKKVRGSYCAEHGRISYTVPRERIKPYIARRRH
jgi:hypothetical protein